MARGRYARQQAVDFVYAQAMRGETDGRGHNPLRASRLVVFAVVSAAGCAEAAFGSADALPGDSASADLLGGPQGAASGDAARSDAAATDPAPSGADARAPMNPDAAPSSPPTAPPTPPSGAECQTDDDCGGGNRICFGSYCVVDPAAPSPVGDGACTNDADETRLSANIEWRRISEICSLTCVKMPQACVNTCVANQTGLSATCAGCYGAWLNCISTFCLFWCAFTDDADCGACRADFCDRPLGICGGFEAPRAF